MDIYLLVAEGPTDKQVISKIAEKISEESGNNISIRLLEPQKSASGPGHEPFGWTCIKTWCINHKIKNEEDIKHLSPELSAAAKRKNWKALVVQSKAKGLIIQIDSDIADKIRGRSRRNPNNQSKKAYVKDSLNDWLSTTGAEPDLHLAVASESIETWLLSTHPPHHAVFQDLQQGFSYEDITDTEARLIRLGYPSKNSRGKQKLKKTPDSYGPHAQRVYENLTEVRTRCASANDLCDYIS